MQIKVMSLNVVGGGHVRSLLSLWLYLDCIEKSCTLIRYINFLTEICICSKEEGKRHHKMALYKFYIAIIPELE